MRMEANLNNENARVHVLHKGCKLVGLEKLALVAVHDHHVPPGQDLSCVEVLPAAACTKSNINNNNDNNNDNNNNNNTNNDNDNNAFQLMLN